jgi:hypothetical protein
LRRSGGGGNKLVVGRELSVEGQEKAEVENP